MSEKKEKKNILIGALLVAIIAMAVGYAALAQQLTINGTAQVSSTWDVKFTSISQGTASNSTGVASTATNKTPAVISGQTTATFDVEFQTPGDTMEYDIVVTNDGSLDAKLANVVATASSATGSGDLQLTEANGINYEITIDGQPYASAKETVLAGKPSGGPANTSTVHVKVWWDEAATTVPENAVKKLTVTLEYVQA